MRFAFFCLLLFFVVFYNQESHAEVVDKTLGPVSDLLIDKNNIYFFETDKTIQSPTWIPDTKVRYNDAEQTKLLSSELFIFPTELNHIESFLFFATLSDECIGQVTCDFQNIVKMSKKDGIFEIVQYGLKSAIHLSINNGKLYVSESNGNIWRMDFDGSNKEMIHNGDNIIMDMSAHGNHVYWIEEIADQQNRVMRVNENNLKIEIIDDELKIPYNLKVTFGVPTWNEIQVKPTSGSINDFTAIKVLDDTVNTVAEFKNTSPVAKSQLEPHYKPYFVYGDYIVFSNNTAAFPVIQLLNYKSGNVLDIKTVEDYEIVYFRADSTNVYVVGKNDDGFVIDRMMLPITIPEFGSIAAILGVSLLAGVVLTRRLSPIR